MEEIANWLKSNRNYLVGVAIYQKYGDNSVLKDLLSKSHNPYLEKKMITSLQELQCRLAASVPPPETVVIPVRPTVVKEINPPAARSESIIKNLIKRKGELFREAASLHAHLHHMSQADAAKAAPVILNNFHEINRIWQIIDNYESTGFLPPKLAGSMSLKDFTGRLKNIPTYITKLKRQLEDEKEESRKKEISITLANYESELEQLKNIMENDAILIQA